MWFTVMPSPKSKLSKIIWDKSSSGTGSSGNGSSGTGSSGTGAKGTSFASVKSSSGDVTVTVPEGSVLGGK